VSGELIVLLVMLTAALAAWVAPVTRAALVVARKRWAPRLLAPEALAALEREAVDPVADVIRRIDAELYEIERQRRKELTASKPAAQVALAPASWWPEGGRTGLPPGFDRLRIGSTVTTPERAIATRCQECEWSEIRTLGGDGPLFTRVSSCYRHRERHLTAV
jgi:hypothetical protein